MSDEEVGNSDSGESETPQVFLIDTSSDSLLKTRTINLFGVLDEERLIDVVQSLVALRGTCKDLEPGEADGELVEASNPIKFYISTWGGDVLGMFAIYDMMRHVREECIIETVGLGKVMSAGVLLLASGTKGHRKVGKNTRIMLHNVQAGYYGSLPSLENELSETLRMQDQMIAALVAETNLTTRQLKKMLDKKVDVYIGAEEAVELGIADIII